MFYVVCLIDNDIVIFRQDARRIFLEYKVAQQQRMVCDDDICGLELSPRLSVKTLLKIGTFSASAVSVFAFD